jgi:hypothetical protein
VFNCRSLQGIWIFRILVKLYFYDILWSQI